MKRINTNAPATCSKSIIINAHPEKVWEIMTGVNHWPGWQKDIAKAKINGPVVQGTNFDWKTGGANIHSTFHTVVPFKQVGWDGKALGTHAIHNWTLKEIDGKTLVTVEESMEGFLVSLFKKAFSKNLETGMVRWLELLEKESVK